MRTSPVDHKPTTRRSRSQPAASSSRYSGPAIISDGATDATHDIEIHATVGENAATSAWHIIIKGRLTHDIRFPSGKQVVVDLPDGTHCVGMLVDPQLIRGTGDAPC